MVFYVRSQDKPEVGAELDRLGEAHWSYMDRFADRLVLRGPTLSADGSEHTGSIHVVDMDDRASAERFATQEPFWQAGLYEEFTAVRAVVLLREVADPDIPHSLVTARWPPLPRTADDTDPRLQDDRLSSLLLLVDDDGSRTTGVVATVRALPDEAPGLVQPFADRLTGGPVALTAQRWSRGGRS
ncbi:YciI family protein [Streptomyces pseudovenezuelae]|jgi:uncharacterized protein YciI|uniref:Uncharacterized protein YciI n=1 Tax=Streptomyces pseudovenezuelae TaxID=67350 RepID=A0ABT6LWR7_9ACTN|nr:YciI family protein [Streptomyces pseudovenezuelae]MDH6220758.1 uncharacterized protein YciI [Streptomyces pseudovenezuelae]